MEKFILFNHCERLIKQRFYVRLDLLVWLAGRSYCLGYIICSDFADTKPYVDFFAELHQTVRKYENVWLLEASPLQMLLSNFNFRTTWRKGTQSFSKDLNTKTLCETSWFFVPLCVIFSLSLAVSTIKQKVKFHFAKTEYQLKFQTNFTPSKSPSIDPGLFKVSQ